MRGRSTCPSLESWRSVNRQPARSRCPVVSMCVSSTIASRWTRRARASTDSAFRAVDAGGAGFCAAAATVIAAGNATTTNLFRIFMMGAKHTGNWRPNQCASMRATAMNIDRRTALKLGGLAALGAGIGACASRSAAQTTAPRRPLVPLVPVDVAWDRIIRTTVGLRPHRDSGFVLRADKLDAKTIIHNYGHGGAGMSLSWGTGAMAAELALAHEDRRAAVIGCGAVGL